MRGIGLLFVTIILLSALSLPLLRVVDVYTLRKEILGINLEKDLEFVDVEIIKRVLISDLLCRLDLYLSSGKLYPIWTPPNEIVMPAARSWVSSLKIHSKRFGIEEKIDVIDGVHGNIVFDGGGYPLSVKMKISLNGTKVGVSKEEVLSLRHTAKIRKVRELAFYYRDLALKMIRSAMRENRTLAYEWNGGFDAVEISFRVRGGPEVYKYSVEVRDRGKGAMLDLRLNYGFMAEGTLRNETPDQ